MISFDERRLTLCDERVEGIVVIVDNFVYLAYFPLILTCKRWAGSFNRWTGVSQAEIDHITRLTAQLDSISQLKGPAPEDKHPRRQARHQVF